MVAAGEEGTAAEETMEANRSRNRGLFNSSHEGEKYVLILAMNLKSSKKVMGLLLHQNVHGSRAYLRRRKVGGGV
ncbi:unnamed protein product [Arabidopsis halleri]